MPLESSVLPEDFPEPLEHLKEDGDLSWRTLPQPLGVDSKQLLKWGAGRQVQPSWREDAEPDLAREEC